MLRGDEGSRGLVGVLSSLRRLGGVINSSLRRLGCASISAASVGEMESSEKRQEDTREEAWREGLA